MVRPVTQDLYESIAFDCWPRAAAIVDFGLVDQQHYEALYYPIREAEITAKQLDEALGSGPKLTALVNACPSNPHKGIVFHTAYDDLAPDPDEEPIATPA